MDNILIAFYLLDFLVLLAPFLIGWLRGTKVGFLSSVLWLPVIGFHLMLFYAAVGCGHGSGKGGICDYQSLIATGPQILALLGFYLIFYKTNHATSKNT